MKKLVNNFLKFLQVRDVNGKAGGVSFRSGSCLITLLLAYPGEWSEAPEFNYGTVGLHIKKSTEILEKINVC